MNWLGIDYEKRIFGLDILRALAILLVVYGHGHLVAGNSLDFLPSIPLIDGVELFFVLSGLLIGSIVIKTIEKEKSFRFKSILYFWKRRWWRTLPNYYLILLINYLFIKFDIIDNDINQFNWDFLFFMHNFSTGFYGFFWESWSLSIEEWFYIFLPILLFVFHPFLKPKHAILTSIILLILIPVLYRISIADTNVDNFWWDVNFRKVVLTRIDAIGFGVAAAYVKYYFPLFWTKYRYLLFFIGIFIIYFTIKKSFEPNSLYAKVVHLSLASVGAALLLPFFDSIKSTSYYKLKAIVTYVSVISYSMYLINLALVAQVIVKHHPLETKTEKLTMYLLYWICVFVFSTLLYKYYEKRMTQFREK